MQTRQRGNSPGIPYRARIGRQRKGLSPVMSISPPVFPSWAAAPVLVSVAPPNPATPRVSEDAPSRRSVPTESGCPVFDDMISSRLRDRTPAHVKLIVARREWRYEYLSDSRKPHGRRVAYARCMQHNRWCVAPVARGRDVRVRLWARRSPGETTTPASISCGARLRFPRSLRSGTAPHRRYA